MTTKIKTRKQLIDAYIKFFKSKKHKEIPNASLVPSNDPTVLFTTAGMHPLVPYLTGQKHPLGKRLVNVQKCIRTGDIDEVGDSTHHTFFEMLGNWSLGNYRKKEAIEMSYEFLTSKKWLGLDKNKIAITIFAGDKDAPADNEAAKIWLESGIPKERIIRLGKEDNWWGPAGNTGPCGPDTEMFYWRSKKPVPKEFNPNRSTLATEGRIWEEERKKWGEETHNWIEIWNDVFMEYNKTKKGKYEPLKQKNVDTGMGVERTLAALNGLEDNYLTEVWKPIIKEIEKICKETTKIKYDTTERFTRSFRIIADHIKAAVFIISDGVAPSNVQQGYILRRLIRRAIRHGRVLGIKENFTTKLFPAIQKIYSDYPKLKKNKNFILTQLDDEENKFRNTLERGLRQFEKLSRYKIKSTNKYGAQIIGKNNISGKDAFLLFQSYGFPIEMTQELAMEKGIEVDEKGFYKELAKHQTLSRTASAGTFSSGLSDSSEQTTRLHTATHLLNEALRQVLGPEVKQRGSNITPERLRFDFNFPRKLTPEEIKKVEDLVNKKIKQGLKVVKEEMTLNKALDLGAQAEFGHKYPNKVSIYTILDPSEKKSWFSKEICTGPHVKNTKEIGRFKIVKEQSSAAGIRRIKAKTQH